MNPKPSKFEWSRHSPMIQRQVSPLRRMNLRLLPIHRARRKRRTMLPRQSKSPRNPAQTKVLRSTRAALWVKGECPVQHLGAFYYSLWLTEKEREESERAHCQRLSTWKPDSLDATM